MPNEINILGRSISRGRTQIVNCYRARVTTAPTEPDANHITRVKSTASGSADFKNHSTQCLLYADTCR